MSKKHLNDMKHVGDHGIFFLKPATMAAFNFL
jgi:hypothetical protein